MKNNRFEKRIALWVVFFMLLGVLVLPTFAADAAVAEETEEVTDPYAVFWASELQNWAPEDNAKVSHRFVEENGLTLMRMQVEHETNDPYIGFQVPAGYNADQYQYVLFVERTPNFTPGLTHGMFYCTEGGKQAYTHGYSNSAVYSQMDGWQFLTYQMTESPGWSGEILNIRFDFFEKYTGNSLPGMYTDLAAVIFAESPAAAYDASVEVLNRLYPAEQVIDDFKQEEYGYFCYGSPTKTTFTIQNGNGIFTSTGNHSDPSTKFDYQGLMAFRDEKPLTTDDFRYTVFRYRTSGNIPSKSMQLFVYTGDHPISNIPMLKYTTEGNYDCHNGSTSYMDTATWKGMTVDMAQSDGLTGENVRQAYGWQGRGAFNGWRWDWCGVGSDTAKMEISHILFFADKEKADAYVATLNTMTLWLPPIGEEETEEETWESFDIDEPWDTETESVSETETLPIFVEESSEEISEDISETLPIFEEDSSESVSGGESEESEVESSEPASETSEPASETDESSETEWDPEPSVGGNIGDGGGMGTLDGGGTPSADQDTGSKLPLYIAWCFLGALSVASVLSVVLIRCAEKARVKRANRALG